MTASPGGSQAAGPIIVERTYDAPVETVWRAITDRNLMKEWYFDLREFRPRVGFEFTFTGGTDAHQYLHRCRILEVVDRKRLRHSWRYEGYEGNSVVSFELFPEGRKTRLVLTHEGLETFPSSNPDFARANFVEGWTAIIGSSLKNFVEGTGHASIQ